MNSKNLISSAKEVIKLEINSLKKLQSSMKNKKIKIDLFLNNGSHSYTIKTSDLSKQYVHLNSAYPS